MPTNRLPFAILVSRDVQFVGILDRFAKLGDDLLLARRDNVDGLKALLHVDRKA